MHLRGSVESKAQLIVVLELSEDLCFNFKKKTFFQRKKPETRNYRLPISRSI
jgi:hypothetical protein